MFININSQGRKTYLEKGSVIPLPKSVPAIQYCLFPSIILSANKCSIFAVLHGSLGLAVTCKIQEIWDLPLSQFLVNTSLLMHVFSEVIFSSSCGQLWILNVLLKHLH